MTDTSSEEHRAACEARYLARRPAHEITEFLELVEKRRGKEAADKLRKDAREAWKTKSSTTQKRG